VIGVNAAAKSFTAAVGVDDGSGPTDAAQFSVYGDGKLLTKSDVIHHGDKPKELSVDLTGVKQMVLKVDGGGNGTTGDNADWADPKITLDPANAKARPETVEASTEVKEEAAK
jgi:alpha-galactosidase